MADTVDMSLDDIIKQQRKNNRSNKSKTNSANNGKSKVAQSRIRPKAHTKGLVTKKSPIKESSEQMLHISNLHFGVSNKDLRELFEDIGPLKKATVHYDKSGRSLGTAEVTFFSKDAAIRATNKYNQRHLDGRPMDIKLVPSRPMQALGIKSGSGIKKRLPQKAGAGRNQQQGQNKGPRKGNLGRNTGKPGNKRPPKPELTAAQLDAELESYKEEKMNVE